MNLAAKVAAITGKNVRSVSDAQGGTEGVASTASSSTVVSFSEEALRLMGLRNISTEQKDQFRTILDQAQAANVAENPKQFLSGLSNSELSVLQKVHSLADPIDVSTLSNEGAFNLLVEPGQAKDLNNNGLTQIGRANTIVFPPDNAPESFKAAWKKASEGMSSMDIPMELGLAVGLANLHQDPATGKVYSVDPDDPRWVNPYADSNYDYSSAVSNVMSSLDYSFKLGMMSRYQYDLEMGFYQRLQGAMNS